MTFSPYTLPMEFSRQIEKKETRTTNLNANLSQTNTGFLVEEGREEGLQQSTVFYKNCIPFLCYLFQHFKFLIFSCCFLVLGPVYLLVRRPLIDLLVDLLVKVQRDLLLVSIYSSGSKSISKSF